MDPEAVAKAAAAGRTIAELEAEVDRLRAARAAWRRRAAALAASSTTLVAADEPDRLPAALLRLAADVAEAEAGVLVLVEEDEQELSSRIAVGPCADQLRRTRLDIGECIAGWVIEHGEPAVVPDVNKDRRWQADRYERLGCAVTDMLCIPVRSRDGVLGAVQLINKRGPESFDVADLQVLQPIAAFTAVALDNARLYEEFQRRITELRTLTGVGMAVTARLRLEELLNTIVYLATSVLRAEASSLLLLNEAGDALEFVVALGAKSKEVKELTVPLGEGVAGWVAEHGEALLVPDAAKEPRFTGRIAREVGFPVASILCVPLRAQDEVVGVIELLNPVDGRPFDEHDSDLLTTLANQAAIAIKNARLLESQRELFYSTVDALAALIDANDPYTHGHSRAVARYCDMIAEELGLEAAQRETLQLAALLHDIGKLAVDRALIQKSADLTDQELQQIRAHPAVGATVMEHIEHQLMQEVVASIRHHHEWYDGSGFPDHLWGEDIPLLARIIGVADAFHAMISDRPYRPARAPEEAFRELYTWSGVQFDKRAVDALYRAWQANGEGARSAPDPG